MSVCIRWEKKEGKGKGEREVRGGEEGGGVRKRREGEGKKGERKGEKRQGEGVGEKDRNTERETACSKNSGKPFEGFK